MPIAKVPQFTAWSWSRLTMWEACPFKAKCKHLDKLPEPQGPALAHGSDVHAQAEAYVMNRASKVLPESLARFAKEFAGLRKMKPSQLRTELQLAFGKDWKPCDWFGRDAWLRIVVDLQYDKSKLHQRVNIDYKTGKVYEDAASQLDLYNLCAFSQDPPIKMALSEYWYLDQGIMKPAQMMAGQVAKERTRWEKRAAPMFADQLFKPKPGNACRWCPYSMKKGGPCAY